MALLNIVLVVALCASAIADIAVIRPCPESSADACQITEARITPCRTAKQKSDSACKFILDEDASLSFDFVPNFSATKLQTGVYWANGAVDMPFTGLGSSDGCTYTSCPLETGKAQTFNYNMHIGKKLPKGIYPIKWKVWNEENPDQACCFMTTIKMAKKVGQAGKRKAN